MLGILCPGQGAQHAGMLDLLLADPHASVALERVAPALGRHPRALLADPSRLFDNDVAQPLICAAQIAAWAGLQHYAVAARAFAGYSVGELASHACAGAIDAPALVRLALQRAAAMEAAAAEKGRHGGMIGLSGPSSTDVQRVCSGRDAWPAIIIDSSTFVVGGVDDALAGIARKAALQGWKITCLNVGVASHTPLLAAAVEPFRHDLETAGFRDAPVPVASGIDGRLQTGAAHAIDSLARQLSQTIRWSDCLDALHERGCRVYLELGPGRALSRMVRERYAASDVRTLEDFRTLAGAAQWVRRCCDARN
jgi:[acyl-carrier-protein] S-malonyltransferase